MGAIKFKIFNGTRSEQAPRLCDTCASGVVRGATENEEAVHCLFTKGAVRIRVVECNRYVDRTQPSLYDMREIAWVLHLDSKRRKAGFITQTEWRKGEDESDELDD